MEKRLTVDSWRLVGGIGAWEVRLLTIFRFLHRTLEKKILFHTLHFNPVTQFVYIKL